MSSGKNQGGGNGEGFVEYMMPRERVLAALNREEVDRPPVSNPTSVATVDFMDLVEAPFPEAHRNAEAMARLAATGYTELGFDSVMPVFTIIQESSALGCDIQWEEKDNWATVRMHKPICKEPEDIKISDDLLTHNDTKTVLDALTILKKEYGDQVAVIGKTMGPWSLCYHLFGITEFLLMTVDNPDKVKKILDILKESTVMFGQAQIDAGADALTLPDHATGDLVSADYYKDFLKDLHIEFKERIKCPLILHICGKTVDRIPYIAETGFNCFHFDSLNDPKEAMEAAGENLALVGNVNNPVTLYTKGPEEVRKEVYRAMDAGVDIIAPECAIPLRTTIENLKEIPIAVKDYCKEHYPQK